MLPFSSFLSFSLTRKKNGTLNLVFFLCDIIVSIVLLEPKAWKFSCNGAKRQTFEGLSFGGISWLDFVIHFLLTGLTKAQPGSLNFAGTMWYHNHSFHEE